MRFVQLSLEVYITGSILGGTIEMLLRVVPGPRPSIVLWLTLFSLRDHSNFTVIPKVRIGALSLVSLQN